MYYYLHLVAREFGFLEDARAESPLEVLMGMYRCRLFLVIAALVGCAGAFAQQAGIAAIPPDDPEVYFGFFSLQQAIQKDISAAKGASAGAALERAAARHFNVSESDFAILGRVSNSTLGGLSTLAHEAKAYVAQERAAGQTPDPGKLAAFRERRLALLREGAGGLRRSVSPAGWGALQSYISDRYRSHIVRTEPTHAN